jgi:hypothetical protein
MAELVQGKRRKPIATVTMIKTAIVSEFRTLRNKGATPEIIAYSAYLFSEGDVGLCK